MDRFTLYLPVALHDRIVRHCRRERPREACGVLVGLAGEDHARVQRSVAASNIAGECGRWRYQIDWQTLLVEARLGSAGNGNASVVGYYHSHPEGLAVASGLDTRHSWARRTYLIVGLVSNGAREIAAYRRFDDGPDLVRVPICLEQGVAIARCRRARRGDARRNR